MRQSFFYLSVAVALLCAISGVVYAQDKQRPTDVYGELTMLDDIPLTFGTTKPFSQDYDSAAVAIVMRDVAGNKMYDWTDAGTTGNLGVTGQISYIGGGTLFDISGGVNPGFAHSANANATDFALRQNNLGLTVLNGKTGQGLSFRVNDVAVAHATAAGILLDAALAVNGQEITGNPVDIHSAGDVLTELGDAAGVNKLSIRDSGAVEVAAIDSDGNITTSGTVDGRDIAADGTTLDTAILDADIAAAEGFLRKTGAGAYEAIKSNIGAVVAPTANEDSGDGYAVGSVWYDTTADLFYVCLDATVTAAVWQNFQLSDSGLSDIAGLAPTKGRLLVGDGSNWIALGVGADGLQLEAASGEATGLIWAAASSSTAPFVDTTSIVEGSVDATKEMRIEVDGLTTATVRVLTMPDQDIDLTPSTGSFEAADAGLLDIAGIAPTKGRLLVGDGTNWVAVGVGTDGQQLEADSAQASGLIWAAAGGGGTTAPFTDTTSIVEGSGDATKEMRIEVDGITTGTVRVLTMPDQDIDLTPDTGSFAKAGDYFVSIYISDQLGTSITTGTAKMTWRTPFAITVTDVKAALKGSSSSGLPTFDINESGTTVLSTKLTIDVGETTSETAATPEVISDASWVADAEITFDIDVAGTGADGAFITILYDRT